MRQLALVALITASCFDPGLPPLRCNAEHPGCPDGLTCQNDQCEVPAMGELGQAVDLGGDSGLPVSLCADGKGSVVGSKGAWACPGTFSTGKAHALCTTNSGVCQNANLIADGDCLSVKGGFFVGAIAGIANITTSVLGECGTFNSYVYPNVLGFFGCGNATVTTDKPCQGLRPFLRASVANGLYLVGPPPYGIDTVYSTTPTNGVLCCPK